MKRYTITLYKEFEKVCFYSIHEEGVDLCETDQFFIRFKDDAAYSKDIQTIKYWIGKIGNEYGALDRHFRQERKAKAIPVPPLKSKLRLYCHHINEQIVVLGSGGIKSSQKVQDSPDAFPHFEFMNEFASIFQTKINQHRLTISGKQILGDLSFNIKPTQP